MDQYHDLRDWWIHAVEQAQLERDSNSLEALCPVRLTVGSSVLTTAHLQQGPDNRMRINDLKQFIDRTVTLRMTDGETAKVKVSFVDEEYEDIFAAVLESSRPEQYRAPCAVHTFAAADIVSAELSE
jgi:hypothetical protein